MSGDLEHSVPHFAELKEVSVRLRRDINDVHRAKEGDSQTLFLFVWPPQHANTFKRPTFSHSLVSTTIDDDDSTLTR